MFHRNISTALYRKDDVDSKLNQMDSMEKVLFLGLVFLACIVAQL